MATDMKTGATNALPYEHVAQMQDPNIETQCKYPILT